MDSAVCGRAVAGGRPFFKAACALRAPLETELMTIMETRPAVDAAGEMQQLLAALIALRKGDAEVRLPMHWSGVAGRVADAFNDGVEQNANMAEELARLPRGGGTDG